MPRNLILGQMQEHLSAWLLGRLVGARCQSQPSSPTVFVDVPWKINLGMCSGWINFPNTEEVQPLPGCREG